MGNRERWILERLVPEGSSGQKRDSRLWERLVPGGSTGKKRDSRLLELLYPRRCPVCGDVAWPKGALACPECRRKLSFIEEPTCKRCGREISAPEMEFCRDCASRKRSLDGAVALLHYDAAARRSIAGFKYGGRPEYADFYAEELARRYGRQLLRWRPQAIVPVPADRRRQRIRGYNQAQVLAERLGAALHLPVLPQALIRRRHTLAQKELGPAARQKNLEQAIEIYRYPPGLTRVLLADDIYTTGSTAEACARALKKAGVRQVYGVWVCVAGAD